MCVCIHICTGIYIPVYMISFCVCVRAHVHLYIVVYMTVYICVGKFEFECANICVIDCP